MAGKHTLGEASLVMPADHLIQVRGLRKHYRKREALSGVDLQVRRGEVYGLIGPDGAGKSSLLKILAGVLAQDRGEVFMFGQRIDSEATAEHIKPRLGFMPQGLGLNLYGELSVEENIDFFAQLRGVEPETLRARKAQLLAMTRLAAFRQRPMKQLSGGMKQKLGLICTLIHDPDLVILDEPTTGVDPVSRRDFWAILAAQLQARRLTALIATAYLDEAARFHRLSLLYGGRVLAQGEPDALPRAVPGVVVSVHARPQIQALHRLQQHYPQVEAAGSELRVFVDRASPRQALDQIRTALGDCVLESIQTRPPELEDAFVALLRQQGLGTAAPAPVPHASRIGQGDSVAIEARQLSRDFGDFRAVDRICFQVKSGEIFGLLGANGAGKTTAIKMLTGILQPTGGSGQVAGAEIGQASQTIKARIGYLSQAFSLYQDLTVLENLRLYGRIYGLHRRLLRERMRWVLEMADLHGFENQRSGRLPMGIRQRLALGCALIHQPQVLFLDEPTSGVDPLGRRRFWEILVQMARLDQVAILITTHYLSEAEHCDHLALMHAGRIIAAGTPQAMKTALTHEVGQLLEIAVDQPLAALQRLEQAGFPGVALFGQRIHLLAPDPAQARRRIAALLQGLRLQAIQPRTPSLEDVFIYRILAQEGLSSG